MAIINNCVMFSKREGMEGSAKKDKAQKQYVVIPKLEIGQSYLVEEGKPNLSFDLFFEEVESQAKGLIITHTYPDKMIDRFEGRRRAIIKETEKVWLTYQIGANNINPSDIGMLVDLIVRFIEESEKSVVVLEGMEYLVLNNGFETILNFIQHLIRIVMQHHSKLIVPLESKALEGDELAILQRNMEVIKQK